MVAVSPMSSSIGRGESVLTDPCRRRAIIEESLARLSDLTNRVSLVRGTLSAYQREFGEADERAKEATNEAEHLSKVVILLQGLYDELIQSNVHAIADFITQGLKAIFYDQDIECFAVAEPKRNSVSVTFNVRHHTADGVVEGHPLKSFGGGVAAVIDLILRAMCIVRSPDVRNVMVLDESLVAISDEYVTPTAAFIRDMCMQFDMSVLLVTHKKAFVEHADAVYHATRTPAGRFALKRGE